MPLRTLVLPVFVTLVLVAGAAWTHWQWQAQARSGRAEVLGRLLAIEHAPRMVEAPGVEAWLLGLVQEAGARLPAEERTAYEELLHPTWAPRLPASMVAVGEHLHRAPPPVGSEGPIALREIPAPPVEGSTPESSLRTVEHVDLGGHTLVLTRRRGLSESGSLPPALRRAALQLVALREGWADPAPPEGASTGLLLSPPRVIRFYAVAEDGSVLSLPLPVPSAAEALEAETLQSHRRPRAPSLASDSMFLALDFGAPMATQTHYTGIYTDVAGSGFVASVSAPLGPSDDGLHVVIAADLAVDVDLSRLLAAADPSLQLAVADPVREARTPMWQPWSTLVSALPPDAPDELRRQVQVMAIREAREDVWAPQRTLVHHTADAGHGVLLAVQVSQRRWLVGWLSEAPTRIPWGPMVLVPGLLLGVVVWGERARRRLEREREQLRARIEHDVPGRGPAPEGAVALSQHLERALADARQDERNRLAGIVDHGADTLARVLAAQLGTAVDDEAQRFCQWLADYLLRRLHVSQWVLDRWGGPPCHDAGCILGPDHLRGALVQHEHVFAVVGRDAGLRAQLHWNNGTLAAPAPPGEPWVRAFIDWPDGWRLTAPAEGLFGYVLGEALVNAIKHGEPGVPIELDVDLDRGRRELCFRLRNACEAQAEAGPAAKAYGGLAIVTELARICAWPLEPRREASAFELRWRCPVMPERDPGQVD